METSTDSTTTLVNLSVTLSSSPVVKSPPMNLCRVGSGTSSIIVDQENGIEAESRKLPSSRFKGVVPQPNGRWGAQIYEKHQRVWLGTFNQEESAAKAYDIAALRFRGLDAVTNFKSLPDTLEASDVDGIETAFLNSHSKSEIVDMLRKHTYKDELEQSRKQFINRAKFGENFDFTGSNRVYFQNAPVAREQLFVKTVTPSDVGKLNRLVIPKQHAEKHFPLPRGDGDNTDGSSKGVLLNFEDNGRKVWRFRYSYWNSSQSYVFTKGWSRFVKEKNLKAGDVVSFQRSIGPDDNKQLYIDWKVRDDNGPSLIAGLTDSRRLLLNTPVKMVRLFGVNILKAPAACSVADSNTSNAKRLREIEFLSLEGCKKQRVIGAL